MQTKYFKPITLCFLFLSLSKITALSAQDFITIWKTDNPGVSQNNQIRIPGTGTSYTIVWEEIANPANTGTALATDEFTVTFPNPGIYRIRISGDFTSIRFGNVGDRRKILDIENWGNIEWASMDEAFYGCSNLQVSASDAPNLSNVTSLRLMFTLATSFNSPVNHWNVSTITDLQSTFSNTPFNQPLDQWDVSNVKSLANTFNSTTAFNQDLSGWDVSNVENFSGTFNEAIAFNQPLNSWNVSNGKNFAAMFNRASSFDQPLNTWNLSNAVDIGSMFLEAVKFNQPLASWNVSNVINMASTFSNALRFNQDISSWNVSKVINMRLMFAGAEAFNQNINAWDVSNVTNMEGMFFRAINFNQPVDTWQVNKVTTMRNMFREADHFNQPISNWDVSHVTDMFQMFMNATSFNQDIGNWDVRKVKDMFSMFKSALSFNSDISRWDVSAVINMSNMFENATQFNQDIGKWNVRSVEKMPFILKNATSFDYSLGKWNLSAIKSSTNALESALTYTALSVVNYDSTLIGWSTLTANESRIPTRIKFGANNLHFCEGGAARNVLLAFRWEIVDAGTDCSQTISFPQPDDLIYGDTLVLNALSEVNLPIQYTVTGPAQIHGDTLTTTGVGIVSITAHQNGNLLFQPATPVTIDILIKKATLKATIRDTTKIYGSSNPAFTVDYSGFRNNDNENNIPKPVLFTSATEKSEVGPYLIEFIDSGIFSENYDINFQTGTLSIQKAVLTISVMDTVKKYGEPNPKFILQFRGFVNNDDENLLSPIMISCAATEQSSPGTYMIEIINNSDSISNNYAVEFFAGVLTILRAKLTINANDTSKTYGEHNPTFTFTSHGLANHESPNILSGIVLATSAQEDSDAGLYPILLSTIPDGILTNYFIDYLQGILTIHKAQASISADFLSQNFDGTPKTPLISTSPSDLLFEITFTGGTTSPTKAGAYPFDVTITENNYTGTLRDTLLINLVLEVSEAGDVKVFPNPVKDRIFIESNHVMQKISIYANNGLLQSQHLADSTTLSLDLAELKPGQYFIEIISSNNRKTFHRLLKL